MFGEGVGQGTLYLYELVGEPSISMLFGECSFEKGSRTIYGQTKDVVPGTKRQEKMNLQKLSKVKTIS